MYMHICPVCNEIKETVMISDTGYRLEGPCEDCCKKANANVREVEAKERALAAEKYAAERKSLLGSRVIGSSPDFESVGEILV